ncbi:hypothetical protein HU742_000285 [Pseudomonas sp. SWRI102]|uniref:Plasmid maintenance system killer protein n=1 Tax=Pseudomonas marvdashtae TaxID=2745500 RepID=A0A9E2T869_9PSED|nr:hypothetical protein [Pseudomonas marvdashtae]MBV4549586.1 hypothetical protein [Pseudomonas marvdashtae]
MRRYLSFRCSETESLFRKGNTASSGILSMVERKLTMLDAAQWGICFVWSPNGPENIEIVDYH